MHSAASSVLYYKGMEIQSNNSLWSEQVEIEEIALSYAMSVKEDSIPVMSRSQEVDLVFPMFFFYFYFLFIYLYSIFRTRVRVRVTRSHCHTAGHIR